MNSQEYQAAAEREAAVARRYQDAADAAGDDVNPNVKAALHTYAEGWGIDRCLLDFSQLQGLRLTTQTRQPLLDAL